MFVPTSSQRYTNNKSSRFSRYSLTPYYEHRIQEGLNHFVTETYSAIMAFSDFHQDEIGKYNQAYFFYTNTHLAMYIDARKQAIHCYGCELKSKNPKFKIYDYDVPRYDIDSCITFLWIMEMTIR